MFINLLAAVWLWGCTLAGYVSPQQFPYLQFLTITSPFAVLVNLVFLIVWLLSKRKWKVILPIFTLVSCFKTVGAVFAFQPLKSAAFKKEMAVNDTTKVKVMTWNVHGLGIFDRPINKKGPEQILETIQIYNPDIACLVEFYADLEDGIEPHGKKYLKTLGLKEYRFSSDNTIGTKIFLGTSIMSRYPISNYVTYNIAQYIQLLQCDFTMPDASKLRGFFVHLQSFNLSEKDKNFVEEVRAGQKEVKRSVPNVLQVAQKMQKHYVLRSEQVDEIKNIINRSPYPVLICGDLNDLPGSYAYNQLRDNLNDAFTDGGFGLGATYNRLSPTLRIDHIFYDQRKLKCVSTKVIRQSISDHNPMVSVFKLKTTE